MYHLYKFPHISFLMFKSLVKWKKQEYNFQGQNKRESWNDGLRMRKDPQSLSDSWLGIQSKSVNFLKLGLKYVHV